MLVDVGESTFTDIYYANFAFCVYQQRDWSGLRLEGLRDGDATMARHDLLRSLSSAGREASPRFLIDEIRAIEKTTTLPKRLQLDSFLLLLPMCEKINASADNM